MLYKCFVSAGLDFIIWRVYTRQILTCKVDSRAVSVKGRVWHWQLSEVLSISRQPYSRNIDPDVRNLIGRDLHLDLSYVSAFEEHRIWCLESRIIAGSCVHTAGSHVRKHGLCPAALQETPDRPSKQDSQWCFSDGPLVNHWFSRSIAGDNRYDQQTREPMSICVGPASQIVDQHYVNIGSSVCFECYMPHCLFYWPSNDPANIQWGVSISTEWCPSKHKVLNQCCFNVGPAS